MKIFYELSVYLISTFLFMKCFWFFVAECQNFDSRHSNNFAIIGLFAIFLIGGLAICLFFLIMLFIDLFGI